MNHQDTKHEIRSTKSGTNSKIKFSNAPKKDLVLMAKAGIRIVPCSAGAGGSGGNKKIANRRQQQQFENHFNGNSLEFGCIKEANQSILARQSQLTIKTFVNCFDVFELGEKIKSKKAKAG